MESIANRILETARRQSIFRARDIPNTRDPRSTLRRMVRAGQLIEAGRGLYRLPYAVLGVNHSLCEATKRYPGGVICLISALHFHGIGTQMPHETWMMRQDRKSAPKDSSIRFVYCTRSHFEVGIEEHLIEGIPVRIYTPARTIADCFKYRNKIGLDVAIEALREGWRDKRFTMDELWAMLKACRIEGVVQPYVEMLVQ